VTTIAEAPAASFARAAQQVRIRAARASALFVIDRCGVRRGARLTLRLR
jgi:hypothetical protein